ncbi:MAG: site-2 protease family protein [Dehalococcoidia bacterium]
MGSLRILRIAGIDVLIHWSWLAIFFLLVWWLGDGFYGEVDRYSHWSNTEVWLASAVTTLLFFSSVLLHELSHSLMARRLGIPVSSITLFIFGGVSSLTKEPDDAGQEFLVAIVGPLTSFLIGAVCGGVAIALHLNGDGNTVVGAIAEYLAIINVAVGVFNMLPGYPLDGGRVLRSALWARSRSMLKATRWAATAGTTISFMLIALGVLSVLAGNFVGGVWFVVIGWFLRNTSEQSYQQLLYQNTMEGAKVRDVVNHTYAGVPPDVSVAEIVNEYMVGRGQRCVPIVVADDLMGVVSMADLREIPREAWASTSAYRAMTPRERLHVVSPDDDLMLAMELMAQHDVHQLPVIGPQRAFEGFVTRADVLRLIQVRSEVASTPS